MTWGALLISSVLTYLQKIDGAAYTAIVIATVAAYITGNVAQRHIESRSAQQ